MLRMPTAAAHEDELAAVGDVRHLPRAREQSVPAAFRAKGPVLGQDIRKYQTTSGILHAGCLLKADEQVAVPRHTPNVSGHFADSPVLEAGTSRTDKARATTILKRNQSIGLERWIV